MATFQVPQFIEQKAKVVGPLTIKQFGFLAAGGVISYIAYHLFNPALATLIALLCGGSGIALAFVKIHGQDLPKLVYKGFLFFWKPRMYLWQRETPQATFDVRDLEKLEELRKKVGLQEKLKSVALSVMTGKERKESHIRGEQMKGFEAVRHLTGERERAKRIDYKE